MCVCVCVYIYSAIAEAYKERSLAKFVVTMQKFPKELKEVPPSPYTHTHTHTHIQID